MKTWKFNDIYNFASEFNRIEWYNEYCKEWFSYYGIEIEDFESKTNWNYNDIPDLQDLNRIKQNINIILNVFSISNLPISNQQNYSWDVEKANEIERKLNDYLEYIGDWQFAHDICGLAICGNSQRLGGVE